MPLIGPHPKQGDLIEFKRFGYQHWAIYVGGGYVVHLTDQEGFSSLSSAMGGSAVVRKDRLENVAAGWDYQVNNKYDQRREAYPPQKIVNAALGEVGKRMDYRLTSANCEHFVTNLRYGNSLSDQVEDAKMYATGGGVFFIIAAIWAFVYSRMRNNQQRN